MSTISAGDVKTLRDQTGAGMMDCKKALKENGGNVEAAIDWLRTQGIAKAAKKAQRNASEGIIGRYFSSDGQIAALAEVKCETDFVAKTDEFQRIVAAIAQGVGEVNPTDVDAFAQEKIAGGQTVVETLTAATAKIGEKMEVGRFARRTLGVAQKFGHYLHAGNKIGVLLTFDDPNGKLTDDVAKDVAMHVAAMHPQCIRRAEVSSALIAREKAILKEQMADEKKPPEILDKIVTGRLGKFYAEICLEEQIFVKDQQGKQSVGKALASVDGAIRIVDMVRLQVGASH